MTCCYPQKMFEKMLDETIVRLRSTCLREKIDIPLERAAAQFPFDDQPLPQTTSEFIAILGKFLNHLYEHGNPVRHRLRREQAEAEVISSLEQFYPGDRGVRFETAWMYASTNGLQGLTQVAYFLLMLVKHQQYYHYQHWAIVRLIAPLSWNERVVLTDVFLKRIRWKLPEELAGASAGRLALHLPTLLQSHAEDLDLFQDH